MSRIVVIDPGHGGWDPGRVATDGQAEAVSNWQGALALQEALLEYEGVEVAFTHKGSDTYLAEPGPGRQARELSARCWEANRRHADLLFSLHHDGLDDQDARGGSLWVWSNHNAPDGGLRWEPALDGQAGQNHTDPKSYPLAALMVGRIRETLAEFGVPWRTYGDPVGVACSNFGILRNTVGPAVLLEAYYGTNPADVAAARRPEFYQELARAIAAGIAEALGLTRKQTWAYPKVKVILPGGQEAWGMVRDGVAMVQLPGMTTEVPIRPVASAMGRAVRWIPDPPTVDCSE
jgi:N-acetylmuramoyl-L-alanine amidase